MSSEIENQVDENQTTLCENFIIEEGHELDEGEELDDGYYSRQSKYETEQQQIIEEIVEGITLKRRGTLIRTICSIIRYTNLVLYFLFFSYWT